MFIVLHHLSIILSILFPPKIGHAVGGRFPCQVAGQQDAFLAELQLKPIEEKRLRKLLQAP